MLDYYGSSGMAGSSSSSQADPPPSAVDGASLGSLVWGSIERNTGTFCPYAETAEIEAALRARRRVDPPARLSSTRRCTFGATRFTTTS